MPVPSCHVGPRRWPQTCTGFALAISIEVECGSSGRRTAELALFSRFRGRAGCRGGSAPAAYLASLRQWVAERTGVEAYIEPKTTVTDITVVLVAGDGEW